MTDSNSDITNLAMASLRASLTDAAPLSLEVNAQGLESAFIERARAAGAHVYEVPKGGDQDTVVGEILASLDPARIALSADPEAREACLFFGAGAISGERDPARLGDCGAAVTRVAAGVADLGVVALRQDADEHRLGTLVPPVFVAMLERSDLIRGWDALVQPSTMIAGPERAASTTSAGPDVLRAPSELHVVLYG